MGVRGKIAAGAATKLAPQVASGYVRTVLDQAIDGIGPLRSAAATADTKLVDHDGDVEHALRGLIRLHAGLAGVHLVAGIAHLRGYDLENPRVRNAILACMLGEDTVRDLITHKRLPSSPMALATSPVHDPDLDTTLSREVTSELVARTAGRRAVTLIGRRVPFLGGAVGGSSDAYATWQIGSYAAEELKERRR